MYLKLKYFLATVSAKQRFGKRKGLGGVFVKCKSILLMLFRGVRKTFEMTYMSCGSVRKNGLTRGSWAGFGHCHSLILTEQACLRRFGSEL